MKEIITSINPVKFVALCACIIGMIISTVLIMSNIPLVQMVTAWISALIVFVSTVKICCLRSEKGVEQTARAEQAIRDIQDQIDEIEKQVKEMENESY